MGEMADENIECGMDEYFAHKSGDCQDWCPYCEEEKILKRGKDKTQKKQEKLTDDLL